MLKIGISACFFHADPKRALFKGMTLQYIEQNMAHWVMQRDALALMIPSPDGTTRRSGSAVTIDDYARELDALLLMGGSDVCPESYGEAALRPEWNGDRVRDEYEIALLKAFVAQAQACARRLPRRADHQRRARRYAVPGHRDSAARRTRASQLGRLRRQFPSDRDRAGYRTRGTVSGPRRSTKTNSVHHQAAKDLGRDLVVEAWSEPDRLVEALRWSGPSYVFGVQWHPEFHDPGDATLLDDTPILDDFLARARH